MAENGQPSPDVQQALAAAISAGQAAAAAAPAFDDSVPPPPLADVSAAGADGVVKNTKAIVCKRCGSKIIALQVCELTQQERDLPKLAVSKEAMQTGVPETSPVTDCWLLRNMMDFDNVGFSHAVGDLKYLTCADCELGPLGWQDRSITPPEFYVAFDRVAYK
eukprot:m.7133 g.7133  ORF g.7133 m.7133 type:complete len:163 (+) comp2822_c0_seq1:255-743(+)